MFKFIIMNEWIFPEQIETLTSNQRIVDYFTAYLHFLITSITNVNYKLKLLKSLILSLKARFLRKLLPIWKNIIAKIVTSLIIINIIEQMIALLPINVMTITKINDINDQ